MQGVESVREYNEKMLRTKNANGERVVREYESNPVEHGDTEEEVQGCEQRELDLSEDFINAIVLSTDQDAKNVCVMSYLIYNNYMVHTEYDPPHRYPSLFGESEINYNFQHQANCCRWEFLNKKVLTICRNNRSKKTLFSPLSSKWKF